MGQSNIYDFVDNKNKDKKARYTNPFKFKYYANRISNSNYRRDNLFNNSKNNEI